MRIGFFILALAALATALPAQAQAPKAPDWGARELHACREDKDCAVVVPPCGKIISVNRDYQQQVQQWYDFVRPSFNCVAVPDGTRLAPVCQNWACNMKTLERDEPSRNEADYCDHDDECVVVLGRCGKKAVVNKWAQDEAQRELGAFTTEGCTSFDGAAPQSLACTRHRCTAVFAPPQEQSPGQQE